MATIADLLTCLEKIAPFALAETWDNVGLLLGDKHSTVQRIGLALDVTPSVLAQAKERQVDCLITHHPLLFQAQKRFLADRWPDKAVLELAARGTALIALHTNLDKAAGGVNDCLAARLQLQHVRPLMPEPIVMQKLVVFVPETHAEQVAQAIFEAGAGQLGNYRDCAFRAVGTGTFRPLTGAHPFIGRTDKVERVSEVRLETIMPAAGAERVLAALKAAHPYEEPAYDVYALQTPFNQPGLGRIGEWEETVMMAQAAALVRKLLHVSALRFTDNGRPVRTVALCGGSGSDLWQTAQCAGADLLITADCKYHEAQQACLEGINLLDLGHDDSERVVLAPLAEHLQEQLAVMPAVEVVVLEEASLWRSE